MYTFLMSFQSLIANDFLKIAKLKELDLGYATTHYARVAKRSPRKRFAAFQLFPNCILNLFLFKNKNT